MNSNIAIYFPSFNDNIKCDKLIVPYKSALMGLQGIELAHNIKTHKYLFYCCSVTSEFF